MPIIPTRWESFRAKVISPDASVNQVKSMQMAFYAGAHCLLEILMQLDESPEPTKKDLAVMQTVINELNEFLDSMRPTN